MKNSLDPVVGKVFAHPVTAECYGPIRLSSAPTSFVSSNGVSLDALAEDSCGNYFTTIHDGSVWFWDHETSDLIPLANSMAEFIRLCTNPPEIELDRTNVKSVWIDPDFAKSFGIGAPRDGWIKKLTKTE